MTGPCSLRLVFADGVAGELQLASVVQGGGPLLAPLRDPAFFALVRVDPEAGTVVWPNGADLDPDVLYHAVATGLDIESARRALSELYSA
ncbi:MAG: DUF2442 domain-containing protein [Gemmatimonadales bacterium]